MGRILLINPNSSAACTAGMALAVAPLARLPGLPRIETLQLDGGPPAVVTWRDWYAVAEPLCRLVEREAALGYIIGCMSDPGLEAVRTVTPRPVLGLFRCAVAAALARAERFGVIGFTQRSLPRQRRALAAMGAERNMAGWVPLDLSMDALTDTEAPKPRLAAAARRLAEEGAEVIVLGCAGLAGHAAFVADQAGLPVIEPCQGAAAQALAAVLGDVTGPPLVPA